MLATSPNHAQRATFAPVADSGATSAFGALNPSPGPAPLGPAPGLAPQLLPASSSRRGLVATASRRSLFGATVAADAIASDRTSPTLGPTPQLLKIASSRTLLSMVEPGELTGPAAAQARRLISDTFAAGSGSTSGSGLGGALGIAPWRQGAGAVNGSFHGATSRRFFFRAYLGELRELAKDLRCSQEALVRKAASVEALKVTLATLKSDFMARTLFALTLITALALPVNFIVMLWAINFTSPNGMDVSPVMIVDASEVEHFGSRGFVAFWPTLGSTVLTVTFTMHRLGYFEALK